MSKFRRNDVVRSGWSDALYVITSATTSAAPVVSELEKIYLATSLKGHCVILLRKYVDEHFDKVGRIKAKELKFIELFYRQ